ncbi:multidrug ABC transporter substrate-binding protein [candidate division GN15 bacterium]|uniref:Multidrug ABC transporter substrate-binding protein n=1 Tax=candidate division GN15 bacterium TaxID=2072418 RepID=A0A855X420_9BACT|nr:MAG: multidrug ABC transporter substrate-binding protein [candidate division GN15 bacterium]
MRFWETIRVAIDSLLRHKTRALLTMLGIIIGVGAVVAMVAVGQGAQMAVETQIASLGTNVLMVFPGATQFGGVSSGAGAAKALDEGDIEAIRTEAPAVAAITPVARTNRQVVAGNLNWFTSIMGGNTDFFTIRDWKLKSGDLFTDQDVRAATKVCVLGQTVVDQLFPDTDPVGQTIRIGNLPFKVLGTLVPKGQNAMGMDQDDFIVAPFPTVQKKIQGSDHVSQILVSAVTKQAIPLAQQQIRDIIRTRHKIPDWQDDDFTIRTQTDISNMAGQTSRIMTMLLASIASVSLLVGGIGIMNIMLVSVTERTREIGLRISIGARRRDILQQFLIEAIVLSLIGGIIGVGLGLVACKIIAGLAGWAVLISPVSVGMAFAFSAAVGVFFGFYPARKASGLSPIEALRYE